MIEQVKPLVAKGTEVSKIILKRNLKDFIFITLGVISAGIGLKSFLLPNHFLDGGAMGISLLINTLTEADLSLLIILVNFPFILMGAKQISRKFAFKSIFAILSLAFLVHIIHLPPITSDKLLIAVFGGFFLGLGIGLTIRGGAVIDGTEVVAITVSRKSSLTVGDFIAIINLLIFACAAFLVNIETAMYSFLTYISASKTVDFVINGIEEYIGVTIISKQAKAIKKTITTDLGRGVTVYKSESGFVKEGVIPTEEKVLFCVVTRLEVSKLLHEVEKIDAQAFVIQHPIKDTRGGMIKKRPLH